MKEVENDSVLYTDAAIEYLKASVDYKMNAIGKKPVWFTIKNFRVGYVIVMYYDNRYNESNGEDL